MPLRLSASCQTTMLERSWGATAQRVGCDEREFERLLQEIGSLKYEDKEATQRDLEGSGLG